MPFFVAALRSHASEDLTCNIPHIWMHLGEAGKLFKKFKEEGVTDIVLIGTVKRPSLKEVIPDWEGVKILASLATKAFGDDSLLRSVIAEVEKRGFTVVGVDTVLPGLLSTSGVYGKYKPSKEDMQDIEHGLKIVSTLGSLDVGQGAVIQEGITLALETIEGTDEMIKRAGLLKRKGKPPVFIKAKKPNQDTRVDLPTIGVNTINNIATQGFAGVAIQANAVLVIDKEEVIKTANKHGLFVFGVDINE